MSTNHPEGDVADSEELRRFREQWRAEVQRSKHAHDGPPQDPQASASTRQVAPADAPIAGASNATTASADVDMRALELYQAAVNAEDSGRHAEAARLYSQAFRLAPGLDSSMAGYTREQPPIGEPTVTSVVPSSPILSSKAHGKRPSVGKASVDGIVGGMEAVKLTSSTHGVHGHDYSTQHHGALAGILRSFPESLEFLPENESEPVPLELLPDELLVHILCHLDATAIERFATVNRKARLVTLDSHIWRCAIFACDSIMHITHDFIDRSSRLSIGHHKSLTTRILTASLNDTGLTTGERTSSNLVSGLTVCT